METDLLSRVTGVIEQVTHCKVKDIDLDGNIKEQLSLDSMQMVQFISLLELEFDREFSLHLMNSHTVNEFIAQLKVELN